MSYKVLVKERSGDLEAEVCKLIDLGWVTSGCCVYIPPDSQDPRSFYMQTLIKPTLVKREGIDEGLRKMIASFQKDVQDNFENKTC